MIDELEIGSREILGQVDLGGFEREHGGRGGGGWKAPRSGEANVGRIAARRGLCMKQEVGKEHVEEMMERKWVLNCVCFGILIKRFYLHTPGSVVVVGSVPPSVEASSSASTRFKPRPLIIAKTKVTLMPIPFIIVPGFGNCCCFIESNDYTPLQTALGSVKYSVKFQMKSL